MTIWLVLIVLGLLVVGVAGASAGSAAGAGVLLVTGVCVGVCVYFLPFIVAHRRGHRNEIAIGVLNLCLGWTLVGWVAALVWAYTVQHDLPEIAQAPMPPASPIKPEDIPRGFPKPAAVEPEPPPAPQALHVSVADELVKLAGLRDAGVLTPDEFEAQKVKLLARS